LYLAVAVLFSFKAPPHQQGKTVSAIVDGSLIFGLPLIAFGLQTCLLKHTEYGLAMSAVMLSVVYLSLSIGLARRYLSSHRLLIESFLALGIGFATLAVPLAFNGYWTSATWALEAVGLIWVGLRQQQWRPRFAGYLLYVGAVVALVLRDGVHAGETPIISGDCLNEVLMAFSAFAIAYLLERFKAAVSASEASLDVVFISMGILWWFVAGIQEITHHLPRLSQSASMIVFACLSAIALLRFSSLWHWQKLTTFVFAFLPFVMIVSLVEFAGGHDRHPASIVNFFALSLFFGVQYRFLWLQARSLVITPSTAKLLVVLHVLTAWLLFIYVFWEAEWVVHHYAVIEPSDKCLLWLVAFIAPFAVLLLMQKRMRWPFDEYEVPYKNWVPMPPCIFPWLMGWI
jgi:uncharacterized membrane protein